MPNYKTLPDKWIRKAVYDGLNGAVVNGETIKVYDSRISIEDAPKAYILIDNQTSTPAKNKCDYDYNCFCRLEVICQYPKSGNSGSKVLLNDVCEEVIDFINQPVVLDNASGIEVIRKNIDFGTGTSQTVGGFLVYRKSVILTFYVV